jgi:hypothetical protein
MKVVKFTQFKPTPFQNGVPKLVGGIGSNANDIQN